MAAEKKQPYLHSIAHVKILMQKTKPSRNCIHQLQSCSKTVLTLDDVAACQRPECMLLVHTGPVEAAHQLIRHQATQHVLNGLPDVLAPFCCQPFYLSQKNKQTQESPSHPSVNKLE